MTRLLDAVLSAIGLVAATPLLLASAIGIKLSSRGPILHRATRAGLDGVPFTMFKLRTMHQSSAVTSRIAGARDPRIFPVGRALRRTKVDELPQLVNVLKGDMSLVGPRAEDVTIVRDHYTPFMWESLTVRPGVTGPGSLDYFADEARLPDDPQEAEAVYLRDLLPRKIALDMVYVRSRSTGYYLQLLVRTGLGIVGLSSLFADKMRREMAIAEDYLAQEV